MPDEQSIKAVGRWAQQSLSEARIRAMISLARGEPGIPVRPEELDSDPYLLNVSNGTLDLRTGELRKHEREDLIILQSQTGPPLSLGGGRLRYWLCPSLM